MKIEKLTPTQEAFMTIVRDEWINFCLGGDTSIDKQKAIDGINWAYQIAKLSPPKFISFADGPMAAQLIANIFPHVCKAIPADLNSASVSASVRASVWDSVWDSVRASVGASVGASVWASVRASVSDSVRASVWDSVWDSVWASVRDSARDSVWASVSASVRASVSDSVSDSVRASVSDSVCASVRASVRDSVRASKSTWNYPLEGLGADAGWTSFYDYFIRIGATENADYCKYRDLIKSGAWEFLWFKDLCVVVCRPESVKKNQRNQLHSYNGPAVTWPSGENYWFLNGIRVNQKIVMSPEKLTKAEILGEKNVDVRREMIRKIGMDRFVALTSPKVLDKQGDYELLSIDLSDTLKDCRYLSMKNPSIGVRHIEGVERECDTVQSAINWRAGDIKKQWKPIQLT